MSDPQTNIELCRKLAREGRITASASTPSTVENQSGVLLRVVGWVKDAYMDIQNRHDNWKWMRRRFSLNTVAGDDSYEYGDATDVDAGAAIARFKRWWVDDIYQPPLCYLQSAGVASQYRLVWLDWEDWDWLYGIGTQNAGKPTYVTVDPQNNLRIGPKPDGIYVVTGWFQRGNQVLAEDDDVPEMPADYHDLIWRRAIEMYGMSSVAPEVFTRSQLEASRTMRALERNQLPPVRLGGALA